MIKKLMSVAALSLLCLISCTDDETVAVGTPGSHTYTMNFLVGFDDYEGAATRAGYSFADGDCVYVLFEQGASAATGTAVYRADTKTWTLSTASTLADTDGAACRLAFFTGSPSATSTSLTLNAQTGIYTASSATYQLSDGLLTVRGRLTPALGRVRFRGVEGLQSSISGLSVPESFDLQNHTYTLRPSKVTSTCGTDGFTPYYYAAFADASARQLTFLIDAETGMRRSFGQEVLAAATSGYISIPTANDHQGWTVVDLATGEEVVVVTLGDVTLSGITSTDARAECRVTGGGSKVNDAGFCWSTSAAPTTNDSHVSVGAQTSTFSAKLTNLTEATTYHIRAYATTDRGVTYGPETTFVTRPPMVGRGLIAYYTFDDGTCDNIRSDNYHGYLVGNGTFITDTPNGEGKALSLLQEQYVNIGYTPIGTSKNWSISLWVKDFGTGSLVTAVSRDRADDPTLAISSTGNAQYISNGSPRSMSFSLGSYQIGEWVHLVLSVANSNNLSLYVNGRRIDATNSPWSCQAGGDRMIIGGKTSDFAWADPMKIDNVRLHNIALTDEEVKQIYDYEK